MKHGLTYTIGLIALATAGLTSGPAGAVNANGPYYATPSWDQKLPASTRFVVLTNWNSEAVLDRETGLVWEQSPSSNTTDWSSARFSCTNKESGGRRGWRLPAMDELASLIDPTVPSPAFALPPGHPFANVQSGDYWSATTSATSDAAAWFVSFDVNLVGQNTKSTSVVHFWCVRGGGVLERY
jgi:hypothetical protein